MLQPFHIAQGLVYALFVASAYADASPAQKGALDAHISSLRQSYAQSGNASPTAEIVYAIMRDGWEPAPEYLEMIQPLMNFVQGELR